jgi:hypothetical protein
VPAAVADALADPQQRVVGVVHNAVDARFARVRSNGAGVVNRDATAFACIAAVRWILMWIASCCGPGMLPMDSLFGLVLLVSGKVILLAK